MSVVKALNVLAPRFDKTVPASAFHFDHHNGRAPHYTAQIAFAGHPPRDTVLIDAEELREARAAIAELIDAAEEFRGVTSGDDAGEAGRIACARLDAALARIGGES